MRTTIDSVKKERLSYSEQNTLYFENVASITVNSNSINPTEEKKWDRGRLPGTF